MDTDASVSSASGGYDSDDYDAAVYHPDHGFLQEPHYDDMDDDMKEARVGTMLPLEIGNWGMYPPKGMKKEKAQTHKDSMMEGASAKTIVLPVNKKITKYNYMGY